MVKHMTPNDEVSLEKMLQALDANYVDAFDKHVQNLLNSIDAAIPGVVQATAKSAGIQWSGPRIKADFMRVCDTSNARNEQLEMYASVLESVSTYVTHVLKTMYESRTNKATSTGEQGQ